MKICLRCGEEHSFGISSRLCGGCSYASINDSLRVKARYFAMYAVKLGLFPPATYFECSDCGDRANCYDHRNYYKPLAVDPVCKGCNSRRGVGFPPPVNKYGVRISLNRLTAYHEGASSLSPTPLRAGGVLR